MEGPTSSFRILNVWFLLFLFVAGVTSWWQTWTSVTGRFRCMKNLLDTDWHGVYFKENDCGLGLCDEVSSHLLYPRWTTREVYSYLVTVLSLSPSHAEATQTGLICCVNMRVLTLKHAARHDSEEGHADLRWPRSHRSIVTSCHGDFQARSLVDTHYRFFSDTSCAGEDQRRYQWRLCLDGN